MTTNVPLTLSDITTEWLSAALAAEGHDVDILSLSFEPMPGIVGALGEVGIIDVVYAGETDLPTSFVGKCPLDDDVARLYNQVMQMYRREAGFYADLAHQVDMNLVGCYVNAFDPETQHELLLLERVTDATPGDLLEGTTVRRMKRLAGDLARMHGTFWHDPQLLELDWMLDWKTPSFELGIPIVQENWAAFLEEQPGFFDPDVIEVLDRTWVQHTVDWLDHYNERHWTFTHIDYELDNILWKGREPIVIDWQTCLRTFPGLDIGCLLACSANEATVEAEREILDHYRAELAAAGGPDWTHEELEEDLAWGTLYFASGATVPARQDNSVHGVKGERMHHRFMKMARGWADACVRWNVPEHIGKHV